MIRLSEMDLNLLIVFKLMYQERKTAVVAEQLGLTQPAISNALARLRKAMGDELFLRGPRGMDPTPFADQIAEPVMYALSTIENAVNVRDVFDPVTSTREFRVAMTDIGEIYFLPRLMEYLDRVAPNVALTSVRASVPDLKQQMESGTVDLAVGLLPQLVTGFFQRHLFNQRYVCLFRRDHPLAQGPLDMEAFTRAQHMVVISDPAGHGRVETLLRQSGVDRVVRLRLPHFVAVPYIIGESDMVVTVTEKFAESVQERFGLASAPHPVQLPDVQIKMVWHRRLHNDASNRWLRTTLHRMFAETGGSGDEDA